MSRALLILALAIQMENEALSQLREDLLKQACTRPQSCIVHGKR